MKDVKDTPKLTFGQKLKNLWNYFTTYEKIWYISILVLAIVFCFVFPEDSDELAVNPKLITILYLVDIISNITCELLISKQSKWNFIVSLLVAVVIHGMTVLIRRFGAKAAPGYAVAKRIIHLINSLADDISHDPRCRGKLQVVFLENYRVSLAEHLMPASEVSQQISTAGKEASGTGNMKFMMNGALTVGTLDGANVEMHEVLGDENMFLFGLHADEVARLKAQGYAPQRLCERDDALKRVVDQLRTGFSDGVSYDDLAQRLLQRDEYMLLQDFASYCAAEQRMAKTYADRAAWDRMSLLNIARSGIFAADRAVAQYADNIWHVPHK